MEEENIPDIDYLINDRKAFDEFVYTPLNKAVDLLKKRWEDKSINDPENIPDILKNGFRSIQYVSVATPNHEINRYVSATDAIDIEPLFFIQTEDKFTPNNSWKRSLGKLKIFNRFDKNNKPRFEYINVIDFNKSNGKCINSVTTSWKQPLVDFHHEMLLKQFNHLSKDRHFFDASSWFKENGMKPKEYYKAFLSLLIKHAIQFENFMLNKEELWFTREIFLPAFIEVYKKFKLKPLIVALEPTEIEGDEFWFSYPAEYKEDIIKKML